MLQSDDHVRTGGKTHYLKMLSQKHEEQMIKSMILNKSQRCRLEAKARRRTVSERTDNYNLSVGDHIMDLFVALIKLDVVIAFGV